jgi:hypothetical protein
MLMARHVSSRETEKRFSASCVPAVLRQVVVPYQQIKKKKKK